MDRIPLTEEPCLRCLSLAKEGTLRAEMVQRMPQGAFAPMGLDKKKCCRDCGAADTLTKVSKALNFKQARVAVGNDRQEQYRLPGAPMGLVLAGIAAPAQEGDLDDQLDWLDRNNWFDLRD